MNMRNRIYTPESRPLDFGLRIETSSCEYDDIKYALIDIKDSLKYLSDKEYEKHRKRNNDIKAINSIDFGICYIINTIFKAIKEDNIAELTVIYYMLSLSEIDIMNIDYSFYFYFKKIIKILFKIVRKNHNEKFYEKGWIFLMEKYYFKMLYYLYKNADYNMYFYNWTKALDKMAFNS